ncbi:MAG: hypothetical protein ABJB40_08880, partial [Acidobacteriota bacterium]
HERGVVRSAPGLYFVGLHFLYAFSSATLMGIGRDAKYIADAVELELHGPPSAKTEPGPRNRSNGQRHSSGRLAALNS